MALLYFRLWDAHRLFSHAGIHYGCTVHIAHAHLHRHTLRTRAWKRMQIKSLSVHKHTRIRTHKLNTSAQHRYTGKCKPLLSIPFTNVITNMYVKPLSVISGHGSCNGLKEGICWYDLGTVLKSHIYTTHEYAYAFLLHGINVSKLLKQ